MNFDRFIVNPDRVVTFNKGNTLQSYEFTAAYDAENRLKSIQYTDGATSVVHRIEYVYGASGFVGIIKNYENSTLVKETRMVRDGFLELQERDQNNVITREYVWGMNLGGGIGGLLALKQNGQNYHYLYDGKGNNVSAVLDATQQIVASYRYDTFGRVMSKSGTLDQPFQFSTKRYDANTGLNYYGYRFYAPALGRWINRDPLGEAGGVNLYGFVRNNPIGWIDPDGLTPRGERGASGGAGGRGSNNPYKHCREFNPPDPRFVRCKHHQTGKWVRVPRPAEMPFPKPAKSEECIQLNPTPPYLPYPSMDPYPAPAPNPSPNEPNPNPSPSPPGFSSDPSPLWPYVLGGAILCSLCPECCLIGVLAF